MQAARLLGVSRNTVRRYCWQLHESSVAISELMGLEELELHVWFNPQRDLAVDHRRYMDLSGHVPLMLEQLGHPGVTKQLLWEEYLAEQPNGYGYSQFRHWLNVLGAPHRASMMQDVDAGQALYVDFAGRTMDVIEPQTGQAHRLPPFVATMGYPYLTYAQALPSQRVFDFIGYFDRAIRYVRGVPKSIVCDNFKSSVVRADRYEPTIQESLADLTAHYETTILPARVAHPQDKSYGAQRGADKSRIWHLATDYYINAGTIILITGASGCGKSFLVCALGHSACDHAYRVVYVNMQKLVARAKIAHLEGQSTKFFDTIRRKQLLIIDGFGLIPLGA